jgi:hypothetical protein
MLEVPNNSIPHSQPGIGKNGIENRIKGDNRSLFDVIANLPAEVTPWAQNSNAFLDNL